MKEGRYFQNLPIGIIFSSTSHPVLIPITKSVLISAAETCIKPVQRSLQPYSPHALSLNSTPQ